MANVSLTRLKACQKEVEEGVLCLSDAEVLLRRAIRLKAQEEDLLPLFRIVAGNEEYPASCPLNLLIAALILITSATFDQRAETFFSIFKSPLPHLFDCKYLGSAVTLLVETLSRLKLIPFRISSDELDSLVLRFLINLKLPADSFVTTYEAKQFLSSLVCLSPFYVEFFGLDHDALFSTYQRSVMNVRPPILDLFLQYALTHVVVAIDTTVVWSH
jgi:hypothetical protein